jgi:Uma2 family endonuclease
MAERKSEPRLYSEDEYLALDSDLDVRYEFFDGHVVAMAGAGDKHVIITGQAVTALNNRLADTFCHAGSSDMRVQLENTPNYVFPDVVVWCDDARWADKARNTLLSPQIVIEGLSASTGHRDGSYKLELYKQIPSLMDYLIVSQNRVYIEHFRRGDEENKWDNFSYYRRDQIIRLGFMNLQIPVQEIYRRVDVPEQMIIFEEMEE